ncbi:hypothetical protein HDIA_2620 [Hartmannibacter diazotrophicus]|uniref:Uncharacterized protein n=1 Tax=Hartmannibacter diazotrophicus TaxID=1482074 RepID=A0A2C9D8U8_9HYPH|nr:hypothetical protein [Hartmannibacter diazotrophicus]SON56161.1 hypothetical protein HDIA_2620 [Hartmannibacter diazotrophicus]
MNRQILLGVIVCLALGIGALGYQVYRDNKQPDGVSISVGRDGVSIEQN